jgi:hypothetical protein
LPLLPHPKCAGPDAHLSALSPRPRGPALASYWQAHEAEGTLGQRQGLVFGTGHLVSLTCEGHTSPSQGLQGAAVVAMVFGDGIPVGDAPSTGACQGAREGYPSP